MREFLNIIYWFLGGYEELEPAWQIGEDGTGGLLFGLITLIAVSIIGAALFYFWLVKKDAKKALVANWLKLMLYTAIAVFFVEELVIASVFTMASEDVGVGVWTGNLLGDSGRVVLFSFMNAIYSTFVYWIFSLLFRRFSNDADHIPSSFQKSKNK